MYSTNRDNFPFSFLIWISFISFSCLIVVTKTSNTVINKSGESRYLYLIPNLREKAENHCVWCQLWVCLVQPLLCWGAFLLCLIYWKFLSWKNVKVCQIFFPAATEMIIWLIPHYVNVQYHIYSFVYVQLSLQPWDGSHLIAVYDSFIVLLNSAHLLGFFVFGVFFENFCHLCSSVFWPVILFPCSVLAWFWYQSTADFVKWT